MTKFKTIWRDEIKTGKTHLQTVKKPYFKIKETKQEI